MTKCQCGITLGRGNLSGKCRPCFVAGLNSSPEMAAKRAAGIRRKFAEDPDFRERQRQALIRYNATMPEAIREQRREHGRRQYREVLSRPEVIAKHQHPEVRARAGRKISDARLAWCPPHLRAEYLGFLRIGIHAHKARAMIEELVALEARRAVRAIEQSMADKRRRQLAQAY